MLHRSAPAIAAFAIGASLLVGIASTSASATTNPATRPHTGVVAKCMSVKYEPAKYIFTCADANIGMNHARYVRWGKTSARGFATYWYNDCTPNCAAGKFHFEKVSFRLFHVDRTKKYGWLFTKIRVTYPNHKKQVYDLPNGPQ